MRMHQHLAAAAVLLSSAAAAHASTVTTTTFTLYDSDFAYTYAPITGHNGNHPKITDDLSSSYTIKDNTPITESFFTAAPNSSSGLTCASGPTKPSCDVVEGTINVTLDFTLKETVKTTTTTIGKNGKTITSTSTTTSTLGPSILSVSGTFYANYDTNPGDPCTDSGTETDCIIWSGESPGASSLTRYVQLGDGKVLDVILPNAQDWDIMPKVTLDLDPPPVPLPASLPLFFGGLSVIGLLGWRRKRGLHSPA
jgi:hypothetical protein